MALTVKKNGTVVIKDEKDAKAALAQMRELKGEIEEILVQNGVPDLEKDAAALKAAVTAWMIENETERLDIEDAHATLVKQTFDSRFIGTNEDLRDIPIEILKGRKVVPLRTILKKNFSKEDFKTIWNRVTRRVVVKEAIEEVIAEGILTVDEISPSFVEREKKPYVRIFED